MGKQTAVPDVQRRLLRQSRAVGVRPCPAVNFVKAAPFLPFRSEVLLISWFRRWCTYTAAPWAR